MTDSMRYAWRRKGVRDLHSPTGATRRIQNKMRGGAIADG